MWVLYSTDGCHLCDQAMALCHQAGIEPEVEDIALNDELFARYGVRIPVLKSRSSDRELGWPFDSFQLAEFINE